MSSFTLKLDPTNPPIHSARAKQVAKELRENEINKRVQIAVQPYQARETELRESNQHLDEQFRHYYTMALRLNTELQETNRSKKELEDENNQLSERIQVMERQVVDVAFELEKSSDVQEKRGLQQTINENRETFKRVRNNLGKTIQHLDTTVAQQRQVLMENAKEIDQLNSCIESFQQDVANSEQALAKSREVANLAVRAVFVTHSYNLELRGRIESLGNDLERATEIIETENNNKAARNNQQVAADLNQHLDDAQNAIDLSTNASSG